MPTAHHLNVLNTNIWCRPSPLSVFLLLPWAIICKLLSLEQQTEPSMLTTLPPFSALILPICLRTSAFTAPSMIYSILTILSHSLWHKFMFLTQVMFFWMHFILSHVPGTHHKIHTMKTCQIFNFPWYMAWALFQPCTRHCLTLLSNSCLSSLCPFDKFIISTIVFSDVRYLLLIIFL